MSALSKVVISQIYMGGGRSGAVYEWDYVELFNAGSASVTLDQVALDYASSTGTTWTSTNYISATIPPGGFFLLALAGEGAGGMPLPSTPFRSAGLNLSRGGGKVALVMRGWFSDGLKCPAGATALVGYGSANCGLGAPAPTSNTQALIRRNLCAGSTTNAADYMLGTPSPRTAATPAMPCP